MGKSQPIANFLLAAISILPLFVNVNPNVNVIITACLTVYIGSFRSVKPSAPTETMSKEHAMSFPFIGSAMLFGLFLLFKFVSKDIVNAVLTFYFTFLGLLALTATVLPLFSPYLPKSWNENLLNFSPERFKNYIDIKLSLSEIVCGIPCSIFCLFYLFKKHWLANNVLGLAFSIQGIEMLSLGSFKIGAILLTGLFFYDIFWVFCTPVMVSVAKSFEAPIKLLFPTGNVSHPFSLLGLGDIVIPGIFLALTLRYDFSQEGKPKFFYSAFLGYIFGIVSTIIVMNYFQAAQPALLYIVPGVIGFLLFHSYYTGEFKKLMEYDESTKTEKSTESEKSTETEKSTEKADLVEKKEN